MIFLIVFITIISFATLEVCSFQIKAASYSPPPLLSSTKNYYSVGESGSSSRRSSSFALLMAEDSPSSSSSLSSSIIKKDLLSLIPKRRFNAPATNITTAKETIKQIESTVNALELLTPYPPLVRSSKAVELLDGNWQLLYSDASEITRISKLPLGFSLGPVYQCINTTNSQFENQALIKHKLLLFSGHTRVIANFSLAPPTTSEDDATTTTDNNNYNRAGIKNFGSRVNVKFQKVVFTLRRFLLLPTFGKVRKAAIPNGPSEQKGVLPCIDVTYLDDTMRISRGGDGSLFVLIRVPKGAKKQPMAMLEPDITDNIIVSNDSPTYDASTDILPSGQKP